MTASTGLMETVRDGGGIYDTFPRSKNGMPTLAVTGGR
jgi:hypothetical protein